MYDNNVIPFFPYITNRLTILSRSKHFQRMEYKDTRTVHHALYIVSQQSLYLFHVKRTYIIHIVHVSILDIDMM